MKTKIIVNHQFKSEEEQIRKEQLKHLVFKTWKRGMLNEESRFISSFEQRG